MCKNRCVPCALGGLLAALTLVPIGCGRDGQPRVAVRGTVRWAGAPLSRGSIVFVPVGDTRGPKAGGPIEDGAYDLEDDLGPSIGRYRVEIHAEDAPPYALDDPREFDAHGGVLPQPTIPAVYNLQSTLFVETREDGDNVFDFDLTAAPGAPAEAPVEQPALDAPNLY